MKMARWLLVKYLLIAVSCLFICGHPLEVPQEKTEFESFDQPEEQTFSQVQPEAEQFEQTEDPFFATEPTFKAAIEEDVKSVFRDSEPIQEEHLFPEDEPVTQATFAADEETTIVNEVFLPQERQEQIHHNAESFDEIADEKFDHHSQDGIEDQEVTTQSSQPEFKDDAPEIFDSETEKPASDQTLLPQFTVNHDDDKEKENQEFEENFEAKASDTFQENVFTTPEPEKVEPETFPENAGDDKSPKPEPDSSKVPKITYSKESFVKLGEEITVDCSVRNVDLTNLSSFKIEWSKEGKSDSFERLSSNEELFHDSAKYEIFHPKGTYQYSLKIKDFSEEDSGLYRCKVDFGEDQIINADVPVKGFQPAHFSDDLTKSIRVIEGDAIAVDCQPGGHPKPEVFWRKLDGNIPFYNSPVLKAHNLEIPKVHRSHVGHYRCFADNGFADPVNSDVLIEVDFKPSIEVSEARIAASVNDEVKLHCVTEGFPEPKITWKKNDERVVPSPNYVIDTYSVDDSKVVSDFTIYSTQLEDFSDYSCVSENSIGREEKTIRLEMKTPPSIEKHSPKEKIFEIKNDVRARNDIPIELKCVGSGVPKPNYVWTKNGRPLNLDNNSKLSLEPESGNLLIKDASIEDNGVYKCFAENELGIASSDEIRLVNSTQLEFVRTEPGHIDLNAELGRPFRMNCPEAKAFPKVHLKWMKTRKVEGGMEAEYVDNERMVVDDKGTLWFSHIKEEDDSIVQGFEYMCIAKSDLHPNDLSVAKTISLSVIPPYDGKDNLKDDTINIETFLMYSSPSEVSLRSDEKGAIWCIFGGEPIPTVQWKRTDGKELDVDGKQVYLKNNRQTLVFRRPQLEDEGEYECSASNGIREEKSHKIKVKIAHIPSFRSNLKNQARIVEEGTKVTFDCDILNKNAVSLKYEWFFNSEYIQPHPTSKKRMDGSKLVIDSAQVSDTGNYACRSSSPHGSAYGQTTLNVIAKIRDSPEIGYSLRSYLEEIRSDIESLSNEVHTLKKTVQMSDDLAMNDDAIDKIVTRLLRNMKKAEDAAVDDMSADEQQSSQNKAKRKKKKKNKNRGKRDGGQATTDKKIDDSKVLEIIPIDHKIYIGEKTHYERVYRKETGKFPSKNNKQFKTNIPPRTTIY